MLLYDAISPYGLVYLAGTLSLFALLKLKLALSFADSLFYTVFIALFAISGARLGYAIFYERNYFLEHPGELFELYKGGMSFHGAILGLTTALIMIVKDGTLRLKICDMLALTALILLPLGRLMNYLGGEIYGTEAAPGTPFAAIYPAIDLKLRHAVTLYEAAGYVLVILPLLLGLKQRGAIKYAGDFACAFMLLQGLLRFCVDFWREPDLSVGPILERFGLGQLLALIQVCCALLLLGYLKQLRRHA